MQYIYPVKDYLTITQKYKGVSVHAGVDFGWRKANSNQPIVAIEDGIVVSKVDGWGNTYTSKKIYGNYVILSHADGNYSLYAHLEKNSVIVKKGQKVKRGDTLGLMGNSGFSQGQHLHFEFRRKNSKSNAVDPLPILMVEGDTPVISDNTLAEYNILRRPILTPVDRNPNVEQVSVTINNLRVRLDHSTSAESTGYYCPVGYYDVLGKYDDGRYEWIQVGETLWIAKVSGVEILEKYIPIYDVMFLETSEREKDLLVKFAEENGLDYSINVR